MTTDPKEFLGVYCPKGCTDHNLYHDDFRYILRLIWGKKLWQTPEPMVVKCPKCGFEAWVSKALRDELGKPDDPYLEDHKVVIPEKAKKK